jgi:capsular exopolysaccharide synthesis family protein
MRMTAPSPLAPPAAPAGEGVHLGAVFGALRRRKGAIFATIVLVNGLAFAAATWLPPRYTATATLLVEPPGRRALEAGAVARPEATPPADAALIPTQIGLLRAPALAAEVIAALGLEEDPELRPQEGALGRLHRSVAGLAARIGLEEVVPAPALPAAAASPTEAAVPAFLERLAVGQQPESRVLVVSFRSRDAEKAARIANEVVRQHLDRQLRGRHEVLDRTERWVSERAAELARELRQAEAEVTAYMAENGLARPNATSPDAQQPPSLRREMAVARAERAMKEARLAQLQALRARGGSLDSLPEVGGSVIIQNLQQQSALLRAREAQAAATLGTNHPTLREIRSEREALDRRIGTEVGNIVRGIEEEAARARMREREMEALLGDSIGRDVGSERAAVRLTELTRVMDTKSTQYRALLVRLDELREQRGLVEPGAEMVSAAMVPQRRDFPRVPLVLGTGFAGSLVLALGLAALLEHQDRYLRAPQHVEQRLGLRNLGLVPRVTGRRRRRALHRYALQNPQSAFAESLRALSFAVERANTAKPTKVLLVTSTSPGEGKTTLAAGLAASAAARGRRVALVDLDLRQPSVARQLGIPRGPGLPEHLQGDATLAEVIHVSRDTPRLHVIATHGPAARPTELLDSPRLAEMIATLRCHYDLVVLDVPPSLGISDALCVGLLADAALFVTRWGTTRDGAALDGIAALEGAGVEILGCALTQVDLKRQAGYGYPAAGEYYRNHRKYFSH